MMRIFKIIAVLLAYPKADLQEALDEISAIVEVDESLPGPQQQGLKEFIAGHKALDLLDWQQHYVELFDRGRALSLLIFEHIHSESRDRGQAMVDLANVYESHGFAVSARELPDHIPLFLEFLSQISKEEALDLLQGAMPVLNLLGARLLERQSPYAALFEALSAIAHDSSGLEAMRGPTTEGPDDCLARMDEIWEEEAVSFMGNQQTCQQTTHTLKYTPNASATAG